MGNQILTPDLLIKFIKPIDSLVDPVRKIKSLINIISLFGCEIIDTK